MADTVEVVGLKEANRALKKLPKFAKEFVRPVMDKTAYQVATMAQARAPRDTGQLYRAISWRTRPRSVGAEVVITDPNAYYWKFLEFGTVKMSARPFLRPSADAVRDDHRRRVQQALDDAADQTVREARPVASGLR